MDLHLMVLPRWLAKFNRRFTNRVLGLIPRSVSPFVVIHHRGRQSGEPYATLAAAFTAPDGFVLPPTYGPEADWVQNVLATGSFTLDRRGVTYPLDDARLIPRAEAWPYLPPLVKLAMRVMRIKWYVRADG